MKFNIPFDVYVFQSGGTTHVLRLGWSPDGHYIVSAHAMNNSGPTAQIIERQGWKIAMDFVGHRKAVTVVVSIDTHISIPQSTYSIIRFKLVSLHWSPVIVDNGFHT